MHAPLVPSNELLQTSASLEAWDAAKKQALRSPMLRFRAGCVLWDPTTGEIIAKGCSHPDIKFSKVLASIHAERHALSSVSWRSTEGLWAVLITFNRRGGVSYTSRPCYSCASALYHADVDRVVYPERDEFGTWTVAGEHPEALLARAPAPVGMYARHQRIPA